MLSWPDFLVGLRIALRARYFWFAGFSVVLLVLSVFLAAQFSGRQPATVSLDIGFSIVRFLLPLILILMSQELLSRECERRYHLGSLSYPRPRYKLLVGRFLVVVVLILGLLLVMALVLALLVGVIADGYAQSSPVSLGFNYLVAIAFVGIELILLAAVACLLAVVASTPSFVLVGTFGFMLVARSFASIVDLLSRDASLVNNPDSYRSSVGFLGYLLPDLGALDVRMVALYGNMEFLPADWVWLLISSLGYALFLMALAVWAFQRKRFG